MTALEADPLDDATMIVGGGRRSDPERLIARLLELDWSVAVAESLTGGLVVSSLVEVPGASAVLRGGIVAYDSALKSSLLGVDAAYLAEHIGCKPCPLEELDSHVSRDRAEAIRVSFFEQLVVYSFLLGG